MSRIVALGGGFGGVVAATKLRKRLGREHKVVLIDRSREHLFTPSLLWLVTGEREPERIRRDLNVMKRQWGHVLPCHFYDDLHLGEQIRQNLSEALPSLFWQLQPLHPAQIHPP